MSGATATVPSPDNSVPREHLAQLQVRKVIFHDVPRKVRGQEIQVTLSEIACALNPDKVALLKDKLVRVLASSAAYVKKQLDQIDVLVAQILKAKPQSIVPEPKGPVQKAQVGLF